jgi:hypothetical protein
MTGDAIKEKWRQQPDDPDPAQDLGYEIDDWERIAAHQEDSEKFLYLPEDEELLREEAFIVITPEDLVELEANR